MLLQQQWQDKFSSTYDPCPYVVVVWRGNILLKRNVAMSNDLIWQPLSVKPCCLRWLFILQFSLSPSLHWENYHWQCLCLPFSLSLLLQFISCRPASGSGAFPECSSSGNVQFRKRSSLIKTGLFGSRLYHWVSHLTLGWWVWKILNILQAHFYQKQLMDMAAAE